MEKRNGEIAMIALFFIGAVFARAELCPPMVELQVYDQVKEGIEKSELDNLRLNEDLKNKAVTLAAAEPDLKDYLKRDLEVLEKSLELKTVDAKFKKSSEDLLKEAKKLKAAKELPETILKVREQAGKNLETYKKIFDKCRKPGNS